MNWKARALSAAIAIMAAGAANAQWAQNENQTAAGGSLIFQAWDASQSFTIDLGPTFNSIYTSASAVTSQAAGDTVYNLGQAFVDAFGSNANVQWHVIADKRSSDATSRPGILVSSQSNTGYGSFNTSAGTTLHSNTTTSYNNIAANVAHPSGFVESTNPAYAPTNFSNAAFNQLSTAVGGIAASGYFAGPIEATTTYAAGPGVSFFTAVINGTTAGVQTAKTAFAGADGAANWILQDNGSLTYHVATPVPEPAAVWMFAIGLAGLLGVARLRRRDV